MPVPIQQIKSDVGKYLKMRRAESDGYNELKVSLLSLVRAAMADDRATVPCDLILMELIRIDTDVKAAQDV